MISPTALMRACRAAVKRVSANPLILAAEIPVGIIELKSGRRLQVTISVQNANHRSVGLDSQTAERSP